MNGRAAQFDAMYRADADPWNFRTSRYEQAKYRSTLAALGRRRYRSGLEAGCSIGVLSTMLSERCDRLLALDVSAVAIAEARRQAPARAAVEYRVAELPRQWPRGGYDLIVLSELLYFLAPQEVEQMARLAVRDLVPGGDCILVNWTGDNDLALDGEQAASLFIDRACQGGLGLAGAERAKCYRIDLLSAPAS